MIQIPSGWTLGRLATLLVVLALCAPAAASAITYDPDDRPALRAGTIDEPANGTTVISTQGYTFRGNTNPKKPARLVAVGERGETRWTHEGLASAWFYDVDPLPNGNLLVSSPRAGDTVIYELDPDTRTRVWERRFDYEDTHDVDKRGDELFIANMRAWNEDEGRSDDRLLVYNLTTNETTWEWYFRDHYPEHTDDGHDEDWTHVNDIDPLGEDGERVLASPRNFDQAIVVNRTTDEVEMRLGSDDDYDVLHEQHNPDYLESENGTPTILVADSENDRVVEYARENGEWTRTWLLEGSLNWPRDADRLPNGNTLVTDTLNHRVMEVTPTGEVVWEYYATWGPYDSERVVHGDGSVGPTIRDQNASGSYTLSGSAELTVEAGDDRGVAESLRAAFAGTPAAPQANDLATRWAHVAPWIRPVWMSGWDLALVVLAALVSVGWVAAELVARRRRIAAAGRRAVRTARRRRPR